MFVVYSACTNSRMQALKGDSETVDRLMVVSARSLTLDVIPNAIYTPAIGSHSMDNVLFPSASKN